GAGRQRTCTPDDAPFKASPATQRMGRHAVRLDCESRRSDHARAAGRHPHIPGGRCLAGHRKIWPGLPRQQRMGPGRRRVRRAGDDLRHARHIADRARRRRAGKLRYCPFPHGAVAGLAQAPAGHRHRAVGGRAVDRVRHVGTAGVRPHPRDVRPAAAAGAVRRRALPWRAGIGPAGGHRHPLRGDHPGHHDHSFHRGRHARRVRRDAPDAQGVGLCAGLNDVGGRVQGRSALHQGWRHRRHHARPGPRAGRNHGGHLRDRQLQPTRLPVAVPGRQRAAPGGLDLPGPGAVLHHVRRAFAVQGAAGTAAQEGGGESMSEASTGERLIQHADRSQERVRLFEKRKRVNQLALTLSLAAMAFGVFWLVWILWETLRLGVAGLSWAMLTQMTPPPNEAGGLANAIYGSFLMVMLATFVGTPIGIMAGIYLADYDTKGWLGSLTRFVNDILLSAPSIVIGLFVYAVVVARYKSFSGWAGVIALALIVIPVVIRTTENMLMLVPSGLREAAYALGAPKWKVIMSITLRAARAGVVTGILLAVARISGETAPLLFTALSNQFWTSSLGEPMASLPVTIFKFAMSPYENWQQLAWSGVFLITVAVLGLNILARVLTRSKI